MNKVSEECPISNELAEVILTTGDYREFKCSSCGRFRISSSALITIRTRSRKEREVLLSQARCDVQGGEGLPYIRNIG